MKIADTDVNKSSLKAMTRLKKKVNHKCPLNY